MADTRIYKVTSKADAALQHRAQAPMRLVRATHPSNALRHVTDSLYTVEVMTNQDFEAALTAGIKVEHIGQEQLQLDDGSAK